MLRSSVLRLIEIYNSTWLKRPELCELWNFEHERLIPIRVAEFVKSHPDCFDRSQKTGHLTGSALVVNDDLTKVFLTHHKKLGIWLQLGGHADGNPLVHDVAMTEAYEESGFSKIEFVPFAKSLFGVHETADEPIPFDMDAHVIPATPKEPEHVHFDIRFLMKVDSHQRHIVSEESHDLRWFTIPEAKMVTSEASMLRQFAKLSVIRNLTT